MTHSEREAELLVRVARLQRSAEALVEALESAGLTRACLHAKQASVDLSIARTFLMNAIRGAGEAAGRKR